MKSSGFEKLHFGQTFSNFPPHLPQNTSQSGLSNWHFEHFIAIPPYVEACRKSCLAELGE
jgi:hypothetical protein